MTVFNTIAPLFLVVLLGAILRQRGFASGEFFSQVNRLVFWVGLPCLLFYKSAKPVEDWRPVAQIVVVMAACLAIGLVAAYLLCRLRRVPREDWGSAAQGAYRANLAYVGLPIGLYALTVQHPERAAAVETLAVLTLALTTPLYNVVSILVLLDRPHHQPVPLSRRHQARLILVRAFTNPLVLSCAAGIAYGRFAHHPLPALVERTCSTLGDMTVPLALLGVGSLLDLRTLRGRFGLTLSMALLKVVVAPLCGYGLARLVGLPPDQMRLTLVFLACPTAAAAFVMADQMGGNAPLTAGIIALSVLLSIPVMMGILLLPL